MMMNLNNLTLNRSALRFYVNFFREQFATQGHQVVNIYLYVNTRNKIINSSMMVLFMK